MVLILSVEQEDITATVIDWLHFYNQSVYRVNCNDFFQNNDYVDFEIGEESLTLFKKDNQSISSKDISAAWIRRFPYRIIDYPDLNISDDYTYNTTRYHLNDELEKWFDYLLLDFAHIGKKTLSSNINGKTDNLIVNKLWILRKAKLFGLHIPESIVSSDLKRLKAFKAKHGNIITKPISDPQHFEFPDDVHLYSFTELLEDDLLDQYDKQLFPTFAQECIDKDYELRLFYWFGEFHTVAIFSQKQESTKTDWRHFGRTKAIRTVPYQLPNDITTKIQKLLDDLDIQTASIDLIKSISGIYYLLEINAMGFFDFVSEKANCFLEKKLAKYLCDLPNE